jgi:hypothetical protein
MILPLFAFACKSNNVSTEVKDVFSIYLVKGSNLSYASQKPSLNDFVLEETPILSINSITSYKWNTHQIAFPSSTKEQLKVREPLIHYLFVTVADDKRIYWGMFLDDADSYGCQNPVIRLLPRNPNASCIPEGFMIDRAYPVYSGNPSDKDIRNDDRIYNALKASGKLVQ